MNELADAAGSGTPLKWAVLVVGIALALILGRALRGRAWSHRWIVSALGFLPFVALRRTSISVVFADYPSGDTMGLEVTLVDFVALVAVAALPARRGPLPYRLVVPLYLAAALASILLAPVPLYGWFSFWKLGRMVLLLLVLTRAFEDPRMPARWLEGAALGVALTVLQAFNQRFVEGLDQAMGTFPHQNSMGMALNAIAPVVLAILLAGRSGPLAWITMGLAATGVVLSLSRGAIAMLLVSVVLTYVVSSVRNFSVKKNLVALAGLGAATLLGLASWGSVARRFETAPEVSAIGREIYVEEAQMMLRDHPFGIGLNQWSHVSSTMGYGERAGLLPMDAGGIAHHIYWLTLAELGFLGFAAFLLFLAAPFRWALPAIVRQRGDVRGDVVAGAAVGLFVTDLHGTLEWAFRQTQVAYVYWSLMAVVWSLARQLAPSRLAAFRTP